MSQISRIIILLACIFVFAVSSSAQARWTLIASDSYGLPYYVDENFTLQPNGIVLGWQKSDFPLNDDYPIGSYYILKKEWNCRDKESRQIQSFIYDRTGKFIREINNNGDWIPHPPGSIGDLILNYVCNSIDERNKFSGKSSSDAEALAEIIKKSNLLTENNSRSEIIRKVAVGEKLVLITEESSGIWYQVYDPKTSAIGWLNGNHIKIVRTRKTAKGGRRAGKSN